MKIKDKLVKQLAEKHGVDPRIVRLIVDYPIKFSREKISDPEDTRPIRLRYFGAFVPKYSYEAQRKEVQNTNRDLQQGVDADNN